MPSPLWVTVAGDLMAREPQQVSGGRDLSGFTGECTQVSACGIGQAVKQDDGYVRRRLRKWAAKRRAMLSRIGGGCLHGSCGSRR